MRIAAAVDMRKGGYEPLVGRAAWFAGTTGGKLDLIFVITPGAPLDSDRYVARMDEELAKLPEPVRGRARCEPGDPADVLVALTDFYDALVVGPRNPSAIERLLLGSISTKVLRRARCGVLIPRGEVRERPERRLLVGVDVHGDGSDFVVDAAAAWARRVGGRLDAVYADPEGPPYVPDAAFREAARKAWERGLEKERLAVESLLARVDEPHRGQALLAHGGPENALVDFSEDYDFVLVGTRARPGLTGFLLGSVAEFVIRNARCDVLTLQTATRVAE